MTQQRYQIAPYTITTRQRADGKDKCYLVYFEREIVATFPVNNPASDDAIKYATHFTSYMNKYYRDAIERLAIR